MTIRIAACKFFSSVLLVAAVGWVAATAFAAPPALPEAPPAPPAAPSSPPSVPEEDVGGASGAPDLDLGVPSADRVGFGVPVTVKAGEVVRGDVVCIGSSAQIDGEVRGGVVVVGGSLEMTGTSREVVGVGSRLHLAEGAKVRRDVVNVGGRLDRDGAEIGGQVTDLAFGPGLLSAGFPVQFHGFPFLWGLGMGIKAGALAIVFFAIVVIAAIVPERVRRIQNEVGPRFGFAFLAGLVGYTALPIVLLMLAVTIIGIPVAILVYFVFLVFKWFGLAGLFAEIGRRIGRTLFARDMSLLGAIALGFLPFAVLRFAPLCIGWTIWFLLEIVAFGLVLVTKAGSPGRVVPAPLVAPPPPVVPPAPAP